MHLKSRGLLIGLGGKEVDGNHDGKLLSPARAIEWICVDGFARELKADWQ